MHMLEPESEVKAHLELSLVYKVYIHFCMKISKTNISCFWVVVVLLFNMTLEVDDSPGMSGVNSQKFNICNYFTGFRDGS